MAKTKNVPKKEEAPKTNYKAIFKNVEKYVLQNNFHEVITEMMHLAIMNQSDNPFKTMAEYLLNKCDTKIEDYANQKVLLELKEKDETIQKLKARIEFLEKGVSAPDIKKEEQLILEIPFPTTTLQNNIQLKPTLSDLSVSGIEPFNQLENAQQEPIQEPIAPQQEKTEYPDFPMTSDDSDVTIVMPADEKSQEVPPRTISTVEIFSSSEEQVYAESNKSEAEIAQKDVELMDTSESIGIDEQSCDTHDSVEMTASSERDKPLGDFDDFEPDYEPEDD